MKLAVDSHSQYQK